jgi:pyruvate-formate lyase-activating enzyme
MREQLACKMRGWLFPYVRSRVLPGDFHPITAYLFVEYKCNIDCWYCWSFNNKVKGMTEDVARRSIDWMHDHGCRVLALMGGEPLLRPDMAHKIVHYAAKKGFWVYIGTNGRLLRPEVAARLADAGTAVFNFALDAWDEKPGLPKALVPVRSNLEYLMRKQYVYGYMVFFNMNICRNNLEDIRMLTEYAREHRLATDYHLNETPMLEQTITLSIFTKIPPILSAGLSDVDRLIDWLIEKNKAGYHGELGAPARNEGVHAMASGQTVLNWLERRWNRAVDERLAGMQGISREENGELRFAEWNCRGGQNNVIIRTDGTLGPCFPMYAATYDWGTIEGHKFEQTQLQEMKKTCQQHCFSTLNHNLGYCYNDARAIKWLWKQVRTGFGGGVRSFED